MTKKLWTGNVSIDFEMAIWAETKEEALVIARRHAPDELETLDDDLVVSVSDSPPSSDLDDALPWGDIGYPEKTVGELKKELGIENPMKERLIKLDEAIKARSVVCGE